MAQKSDPFIIGMQSACETMILNGIDRAPCHPTMLFVIFDEVASGVICAMAIRTRSIGNALKVSYFYDRHARPLLT